MKNNNSCGVHSKNTIDLIGGEVMGLGYPSTLVVNLPYTSS